MHSHAHACVDREIDLGAQALSLLTGFAVSLNRMIKGGTVIDYDRGVVELAANLTSIEMLTAMLVAAVRILTYVTMIDDAQASDAAVIPFQRA